MNLNKPKILTFNHYYLPAYKAGGVVRTLGNMVDHLSDWFDFYVFAQDRDFENKNAFPGIDVNGWNDIGRAKVFFASPENMNFKFIKMFINRTDHDLLYLNSFFSISTSFYPLLMRKLGTIPDKPVVLAPRGQFSVGALDKGYFKKRLFSKIFDKIGIWNNILWHASSHFETNDISNWFERKCNCFEAMDLPAKAHSKVSWGKKAENAVRLVFISRVDFKKNIDYALRLLKKVKFPVIFDIFGPIIEPEYWQSCLAIIEDLPKNIVVNYKGCIDHAEVIKTFAQYELFFFPTKGENYGHVILESMLAGTPVLIADTTPWRDLEKLGVGWDIALDNEEKFVQIINQVAKMKNENFLHFRENVLKWGRDKQLNRFDVEQNVKLFKCALNMIHST